MPRRVTVIDRAWSAREASGTYLAIETDSWIERGVTGFVRTYHGYVQAWSSRWRGAGKVQRVTQLAIVFEGVEYSRRIEGQDVTRRGLVRLAARFARDVAEGRV